ncbi:MAG: PepSY domain-containing protein [Halothiobacillaceae bacterium]
MNKKSVIPGMALVVVGAVTASTLVYADAKRDYEDDSYKHNRILELRERGEILSMEDIMARALAIQPGQLIEAELDRDDGRYVYELKIIDPQGALYELELDATDASLIEHELED